MLLKIFKQKKYPKDAYDHVAARTLMTSWQAAQEHAAATLELFQGQAQMMFLWALPRQILITHGLHGQYCLSRAVPTSSVVSDHSTQYPGLS